MRQNVRSPELRFPRRVAASFNFSLKATGAALFVFNGSEKFADLRFRSSAASTACASVRR